MDITSLEQRLLKLVRGIWYTNLYLSGYRLDILGILCIHAGYMFSQQKGVKKKLLEFKYGNYVIVNHYWLHSCIMYSYKI